jgi:hypothetical protein
MEYASHGGVLDRLDSIFVAPIVFFILSNFKLCFIKNQDYFTGIIFVTVLIIIIRQFIVPCWLEATSLVLFDINNHLYFLETRREVSTNENQIPPVRASCVRRGLWNTKTRPQISISCRQLMHMTN